MIGEKLEKTFKRNVRDTLGDTEQPVKLSTLKISVNIIE